MIRKRILMLLFGVSCILSTYAQEDNGMYNYTYDKQFYYKLDRHDIDEQLENNFKSIDSILSKLRYLKDVGASNIRLHIVGSASLEAPDDYNAKLAMRRSHRLVEYLKRFKVTEDVDVHADDGVYDWTVLSNRVKNEDFPEKEKLQEILATPSNRISIGERKKRIMGLANGDTYRHISARHFKYMRYANMHITAFVPQQAQTIEHRIDTVTLHDTITITIQPQKKRSHKGMFAIRTNLLYDAVAIPNIGVDVYLSRHISLGVNWMYSWWKTDKTHKYWRTYGGDVHADYWLDPTLRWSGHHVGVYGQMVTYDFEWNGRGYQGPKWSWGGGISYGYSFWLSRHFSLDCNIGVGYLSGKLYEYTPGYNTDPKYYKEKERTLNWFGPTKAEVSLIWKIGKE